MLLLLLLLVSECFVIAVFGAQEQEQEQEQEKEKEKEEEKIEEPEEEEFIRQKYVRDDEDPVPWSIDELCHSPFKAQLDFFQVSQFSIFKNYTKDNNVLHFPEFLWISRNNYNPQWTLNRTLRRIKNVICVMEWHPSMVEEANNKRGSFTSMFASQGLAMGEFTREQEDLLMRCFSMFDMDEDGKLEHEDIQRVPSSPSVSIHHRFCCSL